MQEGQNRGFGNVINSYKDRFLLMHILRQKFVLCKINSWIATTLKSVKVQDGENDMRPGCAATGLLRRQRV